MLTVSTGNNAVAAAVRQANPAVVAAYPITPQTEIVEQIANYVTNFCNFCGLRFIRRKFRSNNFYLKSMNWQMLDITSHEIGMVATFMEQIHGSVGRQISDNCR